MENTERCSAQPISETTNVIRNIAGKPANDSSELTKAKREDAEREHRGEINTLCGLSEFTG